MAVLAFDPGGRTGFAILEDDETIITGDFETWSEIDDLIREGDTVLVEKPFMSPSVKPIVFEVYGVVCERCFAKTKRKAIDRPPSDPKFVWIRYELAGKLFGSQHQKDALMHLIMYLTRLSEPWDIEHILKAVKR